MPQHGSHTVAAATEPCPLSFVVPAYNEERNIGRTLAQIHDLLREHARYEIIVVDHGSSDLTARVAEGFGARVLKKPNGTIGGLRNFGGRHASGQVLVFLDADVQLTESWARALPSAVDQLERNPRMITGSDGHVSANPSWLERYWFQSIANRQSNSHIGCAHLILTRAFFTELGGFDETLETGEDYEFSRRALRFGGVIRKMSELKVVHEGYPRDLLGFLRREIWHGSSDFRSTRAALRSKVAIVTVGFLLAHVAALALLLMRMPVHAAAVAALIIALCLTASGAQRGSRRPNVALVNTFLFYVYFLGRSLALGRAVLGHETAKRDRRYLRTTHAEELNT